MRIDLSGGCIPAATLVSNDFIDRLMPSANGEYVKVFLYLLRHAGEEITAAGIADALELTEGDVRRALLRWEREGLLSLGGMSEEGETAPAPADRAVGAGSAAQTAASASAAPRSAAQTAVTASSSRASAAAIPDAQTAASAVASAAGTGGLSAGEDEAESGTSRAGGEETSGAPVPEEPVRPLPAKSAVDFKKLKNDAEFTTLLYIVQRYLSKIFSQTDSETIAYLYDTLGMAPELLTYLAELCAEKGKTSLRYYESIALDWYRRGIRTAEQAKEEGQHYNSEVYAVMKAFGLNGRNPGTEELKYIRKWFEEEAFSKDVVLTACSRTLLRIQKPSFPYTDRILTEWHDAGVRTAAEARKFESSRASAKGRPAQQQGGAGRGTRFTNFEQREDDIDSFALELMKKQMKQG